MNVMFRNMCLIGPEFKDRSTLAVFLWRNTFSKIFSSVCLVTRHDINYLSVFGWPPEVRTIPPNQLESEFKKFNSQPRGRTSKLSENKIDTDTENTPECQGAGCENSDAVVEAAKTETVLFVMDEAALLQLSKQELERWHYMLCYGRYFRVATLSMVHSFFQLDPFNRNQMDEYYVMCVQSESLNRQYVRMAKELGVNIQLFVSKDKHTATYVNRKDESSLGLQFCSKPSSNASAEPPTGNNIFRNMALIGPRMRGKSTLAAYLWRSTFSKLYSRVCLVTNYVEPSHRVGWPPEVYTIPPDMLASEFKKFNSEHKCRACDAPPLQVESEATLLRKSSENKDTGNCSTGRESKEVVPEKGPILFVVDEMLQLNTEQLEVWRHMLCYNRHFKVATLSMVQHFSQLRTFEHCQMDEYYVICLHAKQETFVDSQSEDWPLWMQPERSNNKHYIQMAKELGVNLQIFESNNAYTATYVNAKDTTCTHQFCWPNPAIFLEAVAVPPSLGGNTLHRSNIPLELILQRARFTMDEARTLVNGHNPKLDRATNVLELWSHWFATYVMDDDEFLSQRTYPMILSEQKKQYVLRLVHDYHQICHNSWPLYINPNYVRLPYQPVADNPGPTAEQAEVKERSQILHGVLDERQTPILPEARHQLYFVTTDAKTQSETRFWDLLIDSSGPYTIVVHVPVNPDGYELHLERYQLKQGRISCKTLAMSTGRPLHLGWIGHLTEGDALRLVVAKNVGREMAGEVSYNNVPSEGIVTDYQSGYLKVTRTAETQSQPIS